MSVIINIDHETGDLSQYSSSVTDGGDLSVTVGAALAGTSYGLSCLIDDTNVIYAIKTVIADTSGVFRCRIYFDPNSLTMANNDRFVPITTRNSSSKDVAFLDFNKAAGGYYFRCAIFDDTGSFQPQLSKTYLSDAPHYIEFMLTRATTNISSDGKIDWWIDGIAQTSKVGIDNYDIFNDFAEVLLGAISGLDVGTSGTFYIDQIVINNDGSEIGLYILPLSGKPKQSMFYQRMRN